MWTCIFNELLDRGQPSRLLLTVMELCLLTFCRSFPDLGGEGDESSRQLRLEVGRIFVRQHYVPQ